MQVNVDGVERYTPCSLTDPGAIEISLQDFEPTKLLEPPLLFEDCLDAIRVVSEQMSHERRLKYDNWTSENHGQQGG